MCIVQVFIHIYMLYHAEQFPFSNSQRLCYKLHLSPHSLSLLSLFSHCSCPRDLSVNLSVRGMHTESVPVTMFYSMYAYLSHIPRLHALGIAVCAYVVYYLIQVVKVSRDSAKLGLCYLSSSIVSYPPHPLASHNCLRRWPIQTVPDP